MNTTLKPTYILIGAALLLSACSNDDEPGGFDGQDRRIAFKTSLPTVTSRGDAKTYDNLGCFYVTAFDHDESTKVVNGLLTPYFDHETITIDKTSYFQSSDKCIWPDPGKESHKMSFCAFSPEAAKLGNFQNKSTATATDYKLNFKVKPDIADQADFMTAYATGSMEDNLFSGITLDFVHQLAAVEVKVYGAHKSCDIEIAGVRLGWVAVGDYTFDFSTKEWLYPETPDLGIVEYIYKSGDQIVKCGKNNNIASTAAKSIMGKSSYAMILQLPPKNNEIPEYSQWDIEKDNRNTNKNLYISVLLRIIDATPFAGVQPKEKQRYPYRDLAQGTDALKKGIPRVYLAVNASGTVSTRLYKKVGDYNENDKNYYTDSDCTVPYTLKAGEEVKEFGWASLPVTGKWQQGYIYTYTLDYTLGIGLHDPEVTTEKPKAGDPIISDIVGMNVSVKNWSNVKVDFEVTGH